MISPRFRSCTSRNEWRKTDVTSADPRIEGSGLYWRGAPSAIQAGPFKMAALALTLGPLRQRKYKRAIFWYRFHQNLKYVVYNLSYVQRCVLFLSRFSLNYFSYIMRSNIKNALYYLGMNYNYCPLSRESRLQIFNNLYFA